MVDQGSVPVIVIGTEIERAVVAGCGNDEIAGKPADRPDLFRNATTRQVVHRLRQSCRSGPPPRAGLRVPVRKGRSTRVQSNCRFPRAGAVPLTRRRLAPRFQWLNRVQGFGRLGVFATGACGSTGAGSLSLAASCRSQKNQVAAPAAAAASSSAISHFISVSSTEKCPLPGAL